MTYKALLPCCVDEATGTVDREKEAHCWGQIRAAEQHRERSEDDAVAWRNPATRLRRRERLPQKPPREVAGILAVFPQPFPQGWN